MENRYILKGLKVIDLSSVLAGTSVGTFFAELGASVVKIEHPVHKDVTRTWKLPGEDPDSEISAYFASVNFGKEYLFLDLMKQEDYLCFLNLIAESDILIMNFKKGDDVKLRIQDDHLHSINSRLIIGKINGYGDESDRVAYDLVLQGESGFMSINGTQESGYGKNARRLNRCPCSPSSERSHPSGSLSAGKKRERQGCLCFPL